MPVVRRTIVAIIRHLCTVYGPLDKIICGDLRSKQVVLGCAWSAIGHGLRVRSRLALGVPGPRKKSCRAGWGVLGPAATDTCLLYPCAPASASTRPISKRVRQNRGGVPSDRAVLRACQCADL